MAQKSLSAEASSYSRSEKLRDKDRISPREKKWTKKTSCEGGGETETNQPQYKKKHWHSDIILR